MWMPLTYDAGVKPFTALPVLLPVVFRQALVLVDLMGVLDGDVEQGLLVRLADGGGAHNVGGLQQGVVDGQAAVI